MSSEPIEIHFDKRLNNLNLVQEANSSNRSEYLIVTVLAILMVFGCLAYGWQHYQYRDLEYRIGVAKNAQVDLQKKYETLRSEKQAYRSSERITEHARKLGMNGPEPGQVRPAPTAVEEAPAPELAAQQ